MGSESPHKQRMPLIFNEWMRRYIEEPTRFQIQWESIREFLKEDGKTDPTYGQNCTVYFERLAAEMDALGLLPNV